MRMSQVTLGSAAWTLPGSAPRPPRGRDLDILPDHGELEVAPQWGSQENTVPPDQQDWPYATQC